jgi:hypothetical protein
MKILAQYKTDREIVATEKANSVLTGSSSDLHSSSATLGSVDRDCSRAMKPSVRTGMRRNNRLCIPETEKRIHHLLKEVFLERYR